MKTFLLLFLAAPAQIPDPPPHEEWVTASPLVSNLKPVGMTWNIAGSTVATIECCGCSIRFLPHGDALIVPCKKHKRRMLAIAGHCKP